MLFKRIYNDRFFIFDEELESVFYISLCGRAGRLGHIICNTEKKTRKAIDINNEETDMLYHLYRHLTYIDS